MALKEKLSSWKAVRSAGICPGHFIWRKLAMGNNRGQMTVELALVFPVAIAIAVSAMNAMQFFGLCAAFDRAAANEIRIHCVSPEYGSDVHGRTVAVRQALELAFAQERFVSFDVSMRPVSLDFEEYTAKLTYSPNLFGLGTVDNVFGVDLPRLSHQKTLVVDRYKPGVLF